MINKVDEVGSSGLIVLERRGAKTYLAECLEGTAGAVRWAAACRMEMVVQGDL